ncbi:MAG: GNAT family N-acetyltransferase [Desulfobulbaceae bacterium]|nr:MAG: GNAT family N-acetyltransferase [Desulfobulbaceae bacterium]
MLRIRRLSPDEWTIAKRLRLAALEANPDAFGATLDEEAGYVEGKWRARLARSDCATFVAFTGGDEPAGIIVGAPYGNKAGLFSMWVDARHRGKGFGGALVDVVIDWAKKNGYSELLLDVADNNQPAIALYESRGFAPTGAKGALPAPRDNVTEHQRILRLQTSWL